MSDRRSLTKAVFHLALSKQYLDDWRRDCSSQDRHLAGQWISKTECTLNNIYTAMTPESREQYLAEVKSADILIYDEIFRLLLMMDSTQRELMETVANGIVKGEIVQFVGDEEK